MNSGCSLSFLNICKYFLPYPLTKQIPLRRTLDRPRRRVRRVRPRVAADNRRRAALAALPHHQRRRRAQFIDDALFAGDQFVAEQICQPPLVPERRQTGTADTDANRPHLPRAPVAVADQHRPQLRRSLP